MDLTVFFLRQSVKELRRKLANRLREVFVVITDLLAGGYQVTDDVPHDLLVDVKAVVELRRKVLSDHMAAPTTAMANPPLLLPAAEPPAAAVAGGVGVRAPVDMGGGEVPRGGQLMEMVAAILAEERGVQPTDADMEEFLKELLFFD